MEVRVKKTKKYKPHQIRKPNISWKFLAGTLGLCLLVVGFAWNYGRKTVRAAEQSNGFNIVEVVPDQSQAVLGLYIAGWENIARRDLGELLSGNQGKLEAYSQFFDYDGKNSSGNEPFYFKKDAPMGGRVNNNELFKIRMLAVDGSSYDSTVSARQNFLNNVTAIDKFDESCQINYYKFTAAEFKEKCEKDQNFLNTIQYLHISDGEQISGFSKLYLDATGNSPNMTKMFSADNDISWNMAKTIYEKATTGNSRMAISISANAVRRSTDSEDDGYTSLNLYKLYQMLNYVNDPALFQKWFDSGKKNRIDPADGKIYSNGSNDPAKWTDKAMQNLPNDEIKDKDTADKKNSLRGDENYITGTNENILIFNPDGPYFSTEGCIPSINHILHLFNSSGSGDQEEDLVKVLEIEPCTDFRFETDKAEQLILAGWLGLDDINSLEITCMTPNELNGVTEDLVSEYDVIYVGDRVGKMGTETQYWVDTVEYIDGSRFNLPYQHIGSYEDSIITQTLINGLLEDDKTNAEDFAKLAGKGLLNPPGGSFLQNTSLALALKAKPEELGHARFSGNDITVYMKERLREFADSQQPIILASDVWKLSDELMWHEYYPDQFDPDQLVDTNLYNLFYETYVKNKINYASIYAEADITPQNHPQISDKKPTLKIIDTRNPDGGAPFILEKGDEQETELPQLQKSNELVFSYEAVLPSTSGYTMKVIVDQNGDGIFDEKKPGTGGKAGEQTAEGVEQDIVYPGENDPKIILTSTSNEGDLSIPINSVKEMCQFRVILQEDGGDGPRTSWTGYLRPALTQKQVKILQILSDFDDKGNSLAENAAFKELVNSIPETSQDYRFNFENGIKSVTASEFGSSFSGNGSLDAYDLIIVGFDYGSKYTDIEGDALKALDDYIEVKKKPVIFTKDTISYVNTDHYMAPKEIDYTWVKMTNQDVEEAKKKGEFKEGENYRRQPLTKEEYDLYAEANKGIKDSNDKIYLEDLVNKPDNSYEAVYLPIPEKKLEEDKSMTASLGYSSIEAFGIPSLFNAPGREWNVAEKEKRYMSPKQVNAAFEEMGYATAESSSQFFWRYYDLSLGWITLDEYQRICAEETQVSLSCNTSWKEGWFISHPSGEEVRENFKLRDIIFYPNVNKPEFLKTKILTEEEEAKVDLNSGFKGIDGKDYYLYDGKYLVRAADSNELTSAYWEMKVQKTSDSTSAADREYRIVPVAGKSTALYPEKTEWGYYLSRAFRYVIGMDRFGITSDKKEEIRDTGTTREKKKAPEELQGFTNGALLEFACVKDADGNPVTVNKEPYNADAAGNKGVILGTAPRTSVIEMLNEGVIGKYPFDIQMDDNHRIAVDENHAPYYQLDLERDLGQGKTDDVTVWYTLSGTRERLTPGGPETVSTASGYFDLTRRDAGNNYYLYSKGNSFYTGYNLPEKETELIDLTEAQREEMKLFVNTIYAALSGEAGAGSSYYETLVKTDGESAVSQIAFSTEPSHPNQYVCYYEEDDVETAEDGTIHPKPIQLPFQIQGFNIPPDGSKVAVSIGEKTDTGIGVMPQLELYDPAGNLVQTVPGQKYPELSCVAAKKDPGTGTTVADDIWYQITVNFKMEELDGKTLVIRPVRQGTEPAAPLENAVYAEVRFVMRSLFDLD